MVTPIVVVGAGGFGRETLDVLEAVNREPGAPTFSLQGVVDDHPSAYDLDALVQRGVEYIGTSALVLNRNMRDVRYLIGIGNPGVRQKMAVLFRHAGLLPATAIHPSAVIGSSFRSEPGTVICAGAQISTNVRLGSHVHINPGAIVGHDAQLSDYVSVNPGVIVSGHVEVKTQALLGAGAIILQGLTVGEEAVVGAGAVVVTDVPTRSVVKGVPAR